MTLYLTGHVIKGRSPPSVTRFIIVDFFIPRETKAITNEEDKIEENQELMMIVLILILNMEFNDISVTSISPYLNKTSPYFFLKSSTLPNENQYYKLTFFMSVFPSYRNQSIDLQCKSIDWFLYEGNIGMKKVDRFLKFF